ncbi:MAG TPA: hypothetical protein VGO75_05785 [Gemmatimonadaceae bacterium]|jgi:hypothetical protein|nr:hypothetical protein [Gemmatimonadaceae bacterium]
MGPEIVVPLGAFLCAIVLAIGVPLARAYSRRMDADSRNPRLPTEVTDRLERMERAIDSIAVEVERITEGQRFTTKLLSEGRQVPPSVGPAQDRRT